MEVFARKCTIFVKIPALFCILLLFCCFEVSYSRIHKLKLKEDERHEIRLSTFGFLKKGVLQVNVTYFQFKNNNKIARDESASVSKFGFTLDKSGSSGIASYLEDHQNNKCILEDIPVTSLKDKTISMVFFRMDFKNKQLTILKKGDDVLKLDISAAARTSTNTGRGTITKGNTGKSFSDSNLYQKKPPVKVTPPAPKSGQQDPITTPNPTIKDKKPPKPKAGQQDPKKVSQNTISQNRKRREVSVPKPKIVPLLPSTTKKPFDIHKPEPIPIQGNTTYGYSVSFAINVELPQEEGLYNLYFHNCYNYPVNGKTKNVKSTFDMNIEIEERNDGNFLSAGEIPIPVLFFVLSAVYFIIGIVWMVFLRKAKDDTYSLHYLMFAVVMVKALSDLFNAINMHFIAIEGIHEEAWAVLYYIVYLSRGALLFITIILIGTGWAFIKHVFSNKEKKIFLIVIPLQILDNIAYIIMEESEEGQSQFVLWQEIFIFVDLVCCGAILFPVVWSIRHLGAASQTDGKAAISLLKLKLFRHFYILIVCYIYFTRIIVYLVRISVPFQYEWLDELFKELATCVFFIVTGYKFQPYSDNPYLQVPTEEEEEEVEMEEVITKSGAYDTITHVNKGKSEDQSGLKQRESSHEYD